ncbi:MAG: hypothetical protein EP330_03110, partial [Deltaproteobacteria bacterium]
MRNWLLIAFLVTAASCKNNRQQVPDTATVEDTSTTDTSTTDTGTSDSGGGDTGNQDTGTPVDLDGDGANASVDCDDDPSSCGADCFPGNTAPDDCDGYDNDCDDQVDEDEGQLWYPDCDGDGAFSTTGVSGCSEPTSTSACGDGQLPDGGWSATEPTTPDCDDEDASLNLDDADGDTYTTCAGDCDDDPSGCGALCVPGNTAADTCDGYDVDCDATIGEDDGRRWYPDCDGDGDFAATGVASCAEPTTSPCAGGTAPAGGYTAVAPTTPDCDDADATANHADADEDGVSSCDGDCDDDPSACGADCSPALSVDGCDDYDNDCDNSTDEDPDLNWYLDADQDGSTVGTATLGCDSPGANYRSGASAVEDCNDGDAALNTRDDDGDGETTCAGDCDDDPAACGDQCNTGITLDGCDDYDNDCDTATDEDPGSTVWYLDGDGDGWVESLSGIGQCDSPGANYTTRRSSQVDCNDGDAALNHDDDDSDGVSTCAGDCDDDPAACGADCSPNLSVDACDDYNNDCDGATDEDPPTWYPDLDDDGWTAATGSVEQCDAPSNLYKSTASGTADCDDANAVLNHDDADGDSVTSCAGDCDDDPLACGASCSPLLTVDACDPSQYDNDCDTDTDEDAPFWYQDADRDGWSADLVGQQACSAPASTWSQTVSSLADCDDGAAALNHDDADSDGYSTCADDCDDDPNACGADCAPVTRNDDCDTYDNDCDQQTDENPPTWYEDDDQDGATLASTEACDAPGPRWQSTASAVDDCDDTDATLNQDDADVDTYTTCDGDCDDDPAACGADCFPNNTDPDICDDDDQDCDELIDEDPDILWYEDADGDGYEADGATASCDSPGAAFTTTPSEFDCDDTRPLIHPDALEVFGDGRDQDCDSFELCFIDDDDDYIGSVYSANMPDLLVFDPDGPRSEMVIAAKRLGIPVTVTDSSAAFAAAGAHDLLAINVASDQASNALWDALWPTIDAHINAGDKPALLNYGGFGGHTAGDIPQSNAFDDTNRTLVIQSDGYANIGTYYETSVNADASLFFLPEDMTAADDILATTSSVADSNVLVAGLDRSRVLIQYIEISASEVTSRNESEDVMKLFVNELGFLARFYAADLGDMLRATSELNCAPNNVTSAEFALDCWPGDNSRPSLSALADDPPDAGSSDDNCDGVDGNLIRSTWIAADGTADALGTFFFPTLDIADGVADAYAMNADAYLVGNLDGSDGVWTLSSSLYLQYATDLYGGFAADGSHDGTVETRIVQTTQGSPALRLDPAGSGFTNVSGIERGVRIADITFVSPDATGTSSSANESTSTQYAVHVRDAGTSEVSLFRNVFEAGAGRDGAAGASGTDGGDGALGTVGGSATSSARGSAGSGGDHGNGQATWRAGAGGLGGSASVTPTDSGASAGDGWNGKDIYFAYAPPNGGMGGDFYFSTTSCRGNNGSPGDDAGAVSNGNNGVLPSNQAEGSFTTYWLSLGGGKGGTGPNGESGAGGGGGGG